ncbi:MAG: PBSX family phage terminase large subunit [Clostridia bacterium]|nr:PBSX family phage terminase large subunit [Clostridia bacterium]
MNTAISKESAFVAISRAKAAEEIERRKKYIEQLYEQTNDKFIPLYDNKSRYLVLVGGGGSGKSIFTGRKLLHRTVSEKGHRFLVVRKVARTLRESCFQQLRGQISEHYNYSDFDINKTDMKIVHRPTGNEILFAGLDDVEKLKSIYNITGIWCEEASELEEGDLNQLDIRLRGETKYYKQIILSFNPIDINHWLKKRFFDAVLPDTTTVHSTYKDNKFLDNEAKKVLETFKETDPYYYSVYCLGEWGVLGKTIFDKQKVSERLSQIRDKKPLKTGFFVCEMLYDKIVDKSIRWVDDEQGYIKIYEDVKTNYPYVIGGDTSGEGSDYFIGQVIDNTSGKQVATLRHQFDEDLYAKQIYCLGKYYNEALIGIESNYSTYPIRELERLGYSKQYVREQEDSYTHKIQSSFGFKTTSLTRPIILANLVEMVREHTELINDAVTLEEMLTFVRNEKGRPEAQEGAHDDCIMGLAIAHYIRPQQGHNIINAFKPNLQGISPDALQDYNRADDAGKKHLLEQWGRAEHQVIGKQNGLTIVKKNGKRVYV